MKDDRIFDNQSRQEIPVPQTAPASLPTQKNNAWSRFGHNKPVIISLIVAIFAIGFIVWYFLFSSNKTPPPVSNNVQLLIKGPDQLVSGNEAEYDVTYHNGESADLTNVSLQMLYPSGFTFKSATPTSTTPSGQAFNLPLLRHGANFTVVVRGKLSGSTSEDKLIQGTLKYSLSNFNSEFEVNQSVHTQILPPNLTMDINGPVEVVSGQDSTFTVAYSNVSQQNFDNLAIQLIYPSGFSFTAANPPPAKNQSNWLISHLPTSQSGSIDITGTFVGENESETLVTANLGQMTNNVFQTLITSTATFKIIPSSLSVSLTSDAKNKIVNPGDMINYKLYYGNQGNIGLSNVLISVNLDSTILDFTRLSAANAIINGHNLSWKSATLPDLSLLKPAQSGEINFSVPVKASLGTNLKNQTVNATAQITSSEAPKPTNSMPLALKLSTQLGLIINNSIAAGSNPPQAGKSTTFAVTIMLTNLSNDLSNTSVTASLPLPSYVWTNVIIPDAEKNRLSYDPNSGKITWNIGDLAAFTGKYIPVLKVTFQLKVSPTEGDRGRNLLLLSNIVASGTDTFTQQMVKSDTTQSLTTDSVVQ